MHGLVALMEIQASRARAPSASRASPSCCSTRTAPAGTSCSIRRGLAALARAESLERPARSVHAAGRDRRVPRAGAHGGGDGLGRIVALYDGLVELTPSPIVELNRAVAVGMAFGPAAGLELVDALERAAFLTRNTRERDVLIERAKACR